MRKNEKVRRGGEKGDKKGNKRKGKEEQEREVKGRRGKGINGKNFRFLLIEVLIT